MIEDQKHTWIEIISDVIDEGPRVLLRLLKMRRAVIANIESLFWYSRVKTELGMLNLLCASILCQDVLEELTCSQEEVQLSTISHNGKEAKRENVGDTDVRESALMKIDQISNTYSGADGGPVNATVGNFRDTSCAFDHSSDTIADIMKSVPLGLADVEERSNGWDNGEVKMTDVATNGNTLKIREGYDDCWKNFCIQHTATLRERHCMTEGERRSPTILERLANHSSDTIADIMKSVPLGLADVEERSNGWDNGEVKMTDVATNGNTLKIREGFEAFTGHDNDEQSIQRGFAESLNKTGE
ncbi:hypothetical protein DPMN_032106 [Dreissena polymorpha]|uniref:Uncharacterized protein n=1 Tax=Dreissena polymorpha TaxID=45954 RepID=A0A9D4RHN5_DREPO|nr:hypothetical protein DPMN_032106 [Dreissena polymorpha]